MNDSYYFTYVAVALSQSLGEFGVKSQISPNISNDPSTTYIVFTTHERKRMPKSYIAYNFEQLTTDRKWRAYVFRRFRAALLTLDFSLSNVELLRLRGINAFHAPLGYHPSMELTMNHTPQEKHIDVCFAGEMNVRRRKIAMQFRNVQSRADVHVFITNKLFGKQLAQLYSDCKLSLNIHYYRGRQILEVHRVIPLIIMRVLVLSEYSYDCWLDKTFTGLVDFTFPHLMANTSLAILKRPDISEEVEARFRRLKACCSYTRFLQTTLQQLVVTS